ncbi:MAG: hypothetical protein RLZZ494_671, partial [Pseudomonadota bacterium]
LSDEVGPHHSLLIMCAAFRGITAAQATERWPNLTLKKIPQAVLSRCEWGHDDYSLNVTNLPLSAPAPPTSPSLTSTDRRTARGRKTAALNAGQSGLFGDEA